MAQTKPTPTARRLRRFFCAKLITEEGQRVSLSCEETRHLKQSLRLKEGDRCLLVDSAGITAEAEIISFQKTGEADLVVKKLVSCKESASVVKLHVFFAMPHRGKTEDLIQKSQELGVSTLHPMQTRRTVVRVAPSSRPRVMARWQRVIREAAKQSAARALTQVLEPAEFKKSLESVPEGAKIAVFHPSEESMKFKNWLETCEELSELYVFLGPEGGFVPEEIQALKERGARQVSLGEHILKVDTAFIGLIASLRWMLDASSEAQT